MARLLLAFLALLAALAGAPAAAQDLPPRPVGPVYDGASIIDDADEQLLVARLRAYNETTGRAVIVATVPSLQGLEIERYAQELAETWDIGGAETQNGLLFLVAPNERRVRIASARGLDVRMTDIMSGRIIRDVVTPRFKAGDLSGGVLAGVDAIIAQLDMDPADARAIEEAEAAAQAEQQEGGFPLGTLLWFAMIFFFFILPMMRRMGGGKRYRRRGIAGGVGDVILWSAIGSAMNSGHGGGGFGGGGGGGGFGGFGGGGGGFSGGGASGSW